MKTLAEIAIRRPVTASMFFLSLLVIGLIASVRLPLEFFPAFDAPLAFIDIPYPGSTPEEVEQTITRPVEEVLATIPGIERLTSNSGPDGSQVIVWFKFGQDLGTKAIEARDRVEAIRPELPDDLQRINVFKWSTSDAPVLNVRVASQRDLSGAYELLERNVKRPLERLPGVARVNLQGVEPRELRIDLIADRITAHGIRINELTARLSQANFSASAGLVDDGDQRYRVQPVGEFRSLDEVRAFPINDEGLRLGDIATVTMSTSERQVWRYLDGWPAVGIEIYKEQGANLVEVATSTLAAIRAMDSNPELQGIDIYLLSNQAENVTSSLFDVAMAGVVGSVLSLFVLYGFLRHWPSTLMVSLAVPVCITITLGAMYFIGLTLNILTLMGLLLGIGMLVDNAVVVVESIFQQREKHPEAPQQAAIDGTRAVQLAVTAGTLTSIVVFAPNMFGEKTQITLFLSQVAITITVALLSSWLVAVSLIPMLASRVAAPPVMKESFISSLRDRYGRLLEWSLRHRISTVLATIALVLLSFVPMSLTKSDMFPANEDGEIRIQYEPTGQYLPEEIRRGVSVVETWLDAHREELGIASVYSWFDSRGNGSTNLVLLDESELPLPISEIRQRIRDGVPQIAQAKISFGEQRRSGSEGVQVTLIGESSEQLGVIADDAMRLLSGIEGLTDMSHSLSGSASRELQVRVDRERAREYGFSAQEIAQLVGAALRGTPLREYRGREGEVPVWMRFAGSEDASIDLLRDLQVQAANGESVPVMAMITLEVRDGPRRLSRIDRETAISINANLTDQTLEEVRPKMQAVMDALPLPAGYSWRFGGAFQQDQEAAQKMLFNTLLAVALIYIVIAALFESLLYPLSIMTAIIFSIFGVYWFFWITGTTFTLMASIGILVLIGVVVNNGIVLVEHINGLRRSGMKRLDAVVNGGRERIRPILMTVGTTVLGLAPLCFATTQIGGDGPAYYPMARAIVGGLLFSTIVSLMVVPTVYVLLDDLRNGTRRMIARARGQRREEGEPAFA